MCLCQLSIDVRAIRIIRYYHFAHDSDTTCFSQTMLPMDCYIGCGKAFGIELVKCTRHKFESISIPETIPGIRLYNLRKQAGI